MKNMKQKMYDQMINDEYYGSPVAILFAVTAGFVIFVSLCLWGIVTFVNWIF